MRLILSALIGLCHTIATSCEPEPQSDCVNGQFWTMLGDQLCPFCVTARPDLGSAEAPR